MADKKISQLTSATTPLAGTEVLPIVQSGSTVKISAADITAGRNVSVAGLTATGDIDLNGNLVINTSGNGIDFSATSGTGTSELLDDYEEGTWTPVVSASSGTITSYTATGKYTKVGRVVTLSFKITLTDNGTGSGTLFVDGVPFSAEASIFDGGAGRESANTGYGFVMVFGTTSRLYVTKADANYPGANGDVLPGTISYIAA